ncbi:hypothetical protein CBP31_12735 [Oceanisphaera profunda]|uniref:Uncharacterized protein n=1 Tax=Oceanisphaera profunda TaxID=1416627 RepID=A0A1Y0D766_9GAMM|nr:hypothetical protein CBP31_12735 [Oceanisphaera profunda]
MVFVEADFAQQHLNIQGGRLFGEKNFATVCSVSFVVCQFIRHGLVLDVSFKLSSYAGPPKLSIYKQGAATGHPSFVGPNLFGPVYFVPFVASRRQRV